MSQPAGNPNDVCYRHPDRRSFILCQRCGRTVCPECQVQAAVGVQCPECVREASKAMPKVRRPLRFGRNSGAPATYALIGVNVGIFAIDYLLRSFGISLGSLLMFYPARDLYVGFAPWTMLTSAFVHANLLHILFNAYSLFIFGRIVEQALGRARFLALYFVSAFGGSTAVLLIGGPNTAVLGASGAVFGLMGAFLVIQRRLGGNSVQILVVVGINLALGFIVPGVSWQAHVGGVLSGAAVAAVLLATRERRQRPLQIAGIAGIVIALIAIGTARLLLG
jgi:membrane associated rhomboid family serine protease